MRIPAYAKLNLALAVGPPEPATRASARNPRAGWHPIAGWFVALDFADELTLVRADRFTLEITAAADAPTALKVDWPRERDLAFRAHTILQAHVGQQLPVTARLSKRVPPGGGLGGGSSDAAAMLLGLNHMFSLGLDVNQLRALGLRLGSDVGYFIDGPRVEDPARAPAPALVSGFGELHEPIACSITDVVLLLPSFGCATPAVYAALDELRGSTEISGQDDVDFLRWKIRKLAGWKAAAPRTDPPLFNDLTEAAVKVEPRLGVLLRHLRLARIPAFVTGSGSSVFVLPPPRQEDPKEFTQVVDWCRRALSLLPADFGPLALVTTRILTPERRVG